ncbi:MAG: serine/threonine protein kinase, partial [Streptomyces sp.]|nr:serine/threonine protein kinase [Streptomyces sp.]
GATLYQAVEGHPPYRRDTPMETAYAIAVDPLEPMRKAGSLEPLIEALLSKDPEDRPTAEQTERALRATWSTGPPTDRSSAVPAAVPTGPWDDDSTTHHTSASPPSPPAQAGRSTRRRRRGRRGRVLVPVLALLAAAATAGTLYMSSHRADRDGAGAVTTPPASASPSPVPDGYHLVRADRLGVSFPVPDGWKPKKQPSDDEVTYTDPTGLAGVTIGMVDPAGSHPVGHFKDIEANTKANYSVYRRLRMQETTFRGKPAAVWEFTFQGRARVFRAIDLGYGTAGGREYDIYLSAPESEWSTYRPVFDNVRDGFTEQPR